MVSTVAESETPALFRMPSPVVAHHALGPAVDRVAIGHVELLLRHVDAQLATARGRLREPLDVDVGDGHVAALVGEGLGGGSADAGAGTGDGEHFVTQ
jgi:hypothetical protein